MCWPSLCIRVSLYNTTSIACRLRGLSAFTTPVYSCTRAAFFSSSSCYSTLYEYVYMSTNPTHPPPARYTGGWMTGINRLSPSDANVSLYTVHAQERTRTQFPTPFAGEVPSPTLHLNIHKRTQHEEHLPVLSTHSFQNNWLHFLFLSVLSFYTFCSFQALRVVCCGRTKNTLGNLLYAAVDRG